MINKLFCACHHFDIWWFGVSIINLKDNMRQLGILVAADSKLKVHPVSQDLSQKTFTPAAAAPDWTKATCLPIFIKYKTDFEHFLLSRIPQNTAGLKHFKLQSLTWESPTDVDISALWCEEVTNRIIRWQLLISSLQSLLKHDWSAALTQPERFWYQSLVPEESAWIRRYERDQPDRVPHRSTHAINLGSVWKSCAVLVITWWLVLVNHPRETSKHAHVSRTKCKGEWTQPPVIINEFTTDDKKSECRRSAERKQPPAEQSLVPGVLLALDWATPPKNGTYTNTVKHQDSDCRWKTNRHGY